MGKVVLRESYISQDRRGYAVVTNNPPISVDKHNHSLLYIPSLLQTQASLQGCCPWSDSAFSAALILRICHLTRGFLGSYSWKACTNNSMKWKRTFQHRSLASSGYMAHLPTKSLGKGGICRQDEGGGCSAECQGMDQTRRAQGLRVREGPASWGRKEKLPGGRARACFEEGKQDGFGQAKGKKRAFHVGTKGDKHLKAGYLRGTVRASWLEQVCLGRTAKMNGDVQGLLRKRNISEAV
jgi:hypothetical protein